MGVIAQLRYPTRFIWMNPRIFLWAIYYRSIGKYYNFGARAECSLCGWKGHAFFDYNTGYGHVYRRSTCPICLSQPRFRATSLLLRELMKARRGKFLHIAPEMLISQLICSFPGIDYLSVDLDPTRAMQKENLTGLSFPDNTFDFILCSYVLQEIPDDAKAIMELFRVLKVGGVAIIDVLLDYHRDVTFEDAAIITPQQRTVAYWHYTNVRLYGRDFPERLRCAGFSVREEYFVRALGTDRIVKYGLDENIPFYLCTKTTDITP